MIARRSLVSVVDDDESVRESLPDLLRELGFAAQAFASAEAFLSSAYVNQTNCLILDVAMPGMTGPDLQMELTRRRRDIPIVFITAAVDETVRARVLAQGAVDCLFKPFSEAALLDAVTTALREPMSDARPVVLVVDDDVSVRESLELLIRQAGWEPELFASAQEFLSRGRVSAPCCLVLDLSLPDLNGLDLQNRIASDQTEMPIIFITAYGDVPTSVQAMKAGAVEFFLKPFGDDALLTAIHHAIERSRTALHHEAEMREISDGYATLTRREREVMGLVVSGLLNKQVGGELGISEITVKAHRGSVMRKMKAGSLPDLVNMAARLKLEPQQGRDERW